MLTKIAVALLATVAVAQDKPMLEPADADIIDIDIKPYYKKIYAYCKMQHNPAYPTTNPFGAFKLSQNGPWANIDIFGFMKQLPPPNPSRHGFAIARSYWFGDDCRNAGSHWNPTSETHGAQEASPSHVGDLKPIYDDFLGNASSYSTSASRPTFYGTQSVLGKAMIVYEGKDDEGLGCTDESYWNGTVGREIACCNIRRVYILSPVELEYAEAEKTDLGRGLSEEFGGEVDIMSEDQFRELFDGMWDDLDEIDDLFDQN